MKIQSSRIIIITIFIIALSFMQGALCCTRHSLTNIGNRCSSYSSSTVIAYEGANYCICQSCRSGHYFDSTKLECCKNSIPNCFKCLGNGAGDCVNCMPTFTKSVGLCVTCSTQIGCK